MTIDPQPLKKKRNHPSLLNPEERVRYIKNQNRDRALRYRQKKEAAYEHRMSQQAVLRQAAANSPTEMLDSGVNVEHRGEIDGNITVNDSAQNKPNATKNPIVDGLATQMTPPDETPVQQPQNQPPEAPAFHLTARDRQQLEADDSTFTPHSWASLAAIIRTNRLEDLLRYPSDLRRYLSWSASTRAAYGSITAFLLQERLHWTPLPSLDPEAGPQFEFVNEIPFADARDYKILRNDWPYGLEDGIVHLVVWLKTPIPTTPDTGDLTRRSRELVEGFMARVFRRAAGEGEEERGSKVLWFKNPTGLQSVRGIDHVHVLVRGVGEEVVDGWVKKNGS